jgi:spore maturation protein CgeB
LPPGCNLVERPLTPDINGSTAATLNLFYVGNVELPFYDLKPVMEMICALKNVALTICCRAQEWEKWQTHYLPLPCERIRIVHAYGEQLRDYYMAADAFLLVWKPNPYLDFAMPVKVFEALGYSLPIIVNDGLRASRFVAEEKIGWVASTMEELRERIVHLTEHRQELQKKREHLDTVRERHTWAMRAQTAANQLQNLPTVKAKEPS